MWYCVKNVNETRTLKQSITNVESVIINTRGENNCTLEIHDSASSNVSDSTLAASIDITNCDNLIQYLPYGLELQSGFTYKTTGNPGNITITYH